MRERGFTLLEMMIVMAVLAILTAMAYPRYTHYVSEARRTDAQTTLLELAGRLERCYTTTYDYRFRDQARTTDCVDLSSTATEGGFYSLSAVIQATSYTLQAVPQGAQASDACGTFTLDNTGRRGASGNAQDCW